MTQSISDKTIRVPRPSPDQIVVASCSEDGATAYVKISKESIWEPWFHAHLAGLLSDAERKLREEHPRQVAG